MEVGKTYFIVYDDKGLHPVKKTLTVKSIVGSLINFTNGETLNSSLIIRAKIVEGGRNDTVRTH